ncbi:MAG TPA: DUF2155 domain-containing protein [Caulobacteraceae bacterium]|jgi:hypothetical protein
MRRQVIIAAAALTALATAVGLVVAQDASVPPVQAPPEEAAPPQGAETPTSPAPAPAGPGYTVLGPSARDGGDGGNRPTARATRPAPAPLQPGEPVPTVKRPRHVGAILQAVDKVTAETLRFEAQVGKPIRYKTLVFTLRACETEATDELVKESAAHVTITSQPKAQPGRVLPDPAQVFRGWMFASSPGLNPFEHPVYDAWLVACTPTAQAVEPGAPTAPAPAPRTQASTIAAASSPG